MNVIRFDYAIYLIEQPSKVAEMAAQIIADRDRHFDTWHDWQRNYAPDAQVMVGRDGWVSGFKFTGEVPEGWRKPDKHGLSWPKVKNTISQTLPKNKPYRDVCEYCEDYSIEIPTVITIYNAAGEQTERYGMGHWFYPVQLLYTSPNADGKRLLALSLPDYEKEIGKKKLELAEGETMYPGEDFDYRNFLEGCRMIPEYEWNYMAGKWQENLKKEQENGTEDLSIGEADRLGAV